MVCKYVISKYSHQVLQLDFNWTLTRICCRLTPYRALKMKNTKLRSTFQTNMAHVLMAHILGFLGFDGCYRILLVEPLYEVLVRERSKLQAFLTTYFYSLNVVLSAEHEQGKHKLTKKWFENEGVTSISGSAFTFYMESLFSYWESKSRVLREKNYISLQRFSCTNLIQWS